MFFYEQTANNDSHHYMEQMKNHQKENEEKAETIANMKDKIARFSLTPIQLKFVTSSHIINKIVVSRLDRDVAMKRQLIEEQRAKLKLCEQNNKTDKKTIVSRDGIFLTELLYSSL